MRLPGSLFSFVVGALALRMMALEDVGGSMLKTHFLTKALDRVRTERSLHVLAYNRKRLMNIMGITPLIAALKA